MSILQKEMPSIIPEGVSRVDWFAEQIQTHIRDYYAYDFDELYDAINKAIRDHRPLFHTAPYQDRREVRADFTTALEQLVARCVIEHDEDSKYSWVDEKYREDHQRRKDNEVKAKETLRDIVDILARYGVKSGHSVSDRFIQFKSLDDILEMKALLTTRLR